MKCEAPVARGLCARRIERTDFPVLTRWFKHPKIHATIHDEECSDSSLKRKFDRLKRCDPFADGECGLILETNEVPVGFVHFMWINWISRTAEVDFFIEPAELRPFLGLIATRKIGQIAFEEFNLHKIYGFMYGFNETSLRFFRGWLKPEATLKGYLLRNGGACDVHVTGMLATEYFSQPSVRRSLRRRNT